MNAAQYLGFFRILLSPVMVLYLADIPYKTPILLAVVMITALTDYLDGYIARHQKQESYFGAILDYTADKIFILTALIVFSVAGDLPIWITMVIMYREFLVMGMRIFSAFHKFKITASKIGKFKTFMLFVAVVALILGYSFNYWIFIICIMLTLISLADYLSKFITAVKRIEKDGD